MSRTIQLPIFKIVERGERNEREERGSLVHVTNKGGWSLLQGQNLNMGFGFQRMFRVAYLHWHHGNPGTLHNVMMPVKSCSKSKDFIINLLILAFQF